MVRSRSCGEGAEEGSIANKDLQRSGVMATSSGDMIFTKSSSSYGKGSCFHVVRARGF